MNLPIKNLHEHIEFLARTYPEKVALQSCDEEGESTEKITYRELAQKIHYAARYLFSLGLKRGDRVVLSFKNCPELLTLSWAAWSVGIVTVPMDTKRDTGELYEYKIGLNKANILIAQEGVLKGIDPSHLKGVVVKTFTDFPEDSGPVAWEDDLSHLALILFTSGTTGHPKGAKLSLLNLIVNADAIKEWLEVGPGDRFFLSLPLHHINSTTFCLSSLLGGAPIIVPATYSNSRFWKQIAKTGATFTSIVQSILYDQLGREEEYESVRSEVRLTKIQIGSAPVVAQTVREFRKKFGISLFQGYGQTETSLRVTGVPMRLPDALYEQLVDENSIGVPMPWADLQIAGDDGGVLGEGQEGELVVKGAAIMEGYLGGEPAFRDGYFLTGDVGFFRIIEGRRFFFLKGRKREIIIKGGVNISPVAIENQLRKISADIDQVYVVAAPDERYGEEIGAVLCWKKDVNPESAMRALKIKLLSGTPHLPAYETPRFLASYRVENLPMTSTGKVQRVFLKDALSKDGFESITTLFTSERYRFVILDPQSPYVAASHALFNQCWQPLTVDLKKYRDDIGKQTIILALDSSNALAGQIALIRTDLSEAELLKKKYGELLGPDVASLHGSGAVCISICNADFKPKTVPEVAREVGDEEVRAYLRGGHDPVLTFHQRAKGGLKRGAELVDVIPAGRPEDRSALGYNMLLKYPMPTEEPVVHGDSPVSDQLIEMVLLIAKDIGLQNVFAFSRPGGLAHYISKHG